MGGTGASLHTNGINSNTQERFILNCVDIFHLKCLDDHYKQFPSNTAPAGYTCPTCCSSLFPPSNLVSPVADVLRTVLTNRPWAREGLGLPLLPFDSTDNESSRGKVISSPLKEAPTNYSVVNVEADTPNTFHRNEPGNKRANQHLFFSFG